MKRELNPAHVAVIALAIVAFGGLSVESSKYLERRLAEETARGLAGPSALVWFTDAETRGGRRREKRTLWCGRVEGEQGRIAVLTRSWNFPFTQRVMDVEAQRRGDRMSEEGSILHRCWELLG